MNDDPEHVTVFSRDHFETEAQVYQTVGFISRIHLTVFQLAQFA